MNIKVNEVLDVKGLACPMPIVRTKKMMNTLEAGAVLEIQATDKGSTADLKAWSNNVGHQYLGTVEEGEVLKHYVRKSSVDEMLEKKHEQVISNEVLAEKLQNKEEIVVLDVREAAEYAFSHIPTAICIPLGELEQRLSEVDKEAEVYVVCRSGNRSDSAAQKPASSGFGKVFNVIPGMSQWNGDTEGVN